MWASEYFGLDAASSLSLSHYMSLSLSLSVCLSVSPSLCHCFCDLGSKPGLWHLRPTLTTIIQQVLQQLCFVVWLLRRKKLMFLQEGVSSRPQAFLVRTFTDISQKRKEKEDRVHGWRETVVRLFLTPSCLHWYTSRDQDPRMWGWG